MPELRDLLRLGTALQFPGGTRILTEGETGTDVFVLISGLGKVTAARHDGSAALLAIRAGGDVVGELSCLDEEPRLATVTAVGTLVARRIGARSFSMFLQEHPHAARQVNNAVTAKLRWATRRRVEFGAYSVQARLARVLSELVRGYGRSTDAGIMIDVPLSHPELAALIGASEPSVQRAVRDFRRRGLLQQGYRQLLILDIDQLHRTAEMPSD